MTRYVILTPHCFIGGKNRGVKGQKICSTALCLSHATCRTVWLYRRHVSHSGKRPALISPVPEGTVQLRDLSQCLHGPAFQMESSSALHIPATPKSHHSHSCAVSLGLGAAFSHVPPTFPQISFFCTFRSFLSPCSTGSVLQDVSQTTCRLPSQGRHDPARRMQSRAVSHTRWKCTEPAPRVAALKVHFHSSHFHRVTLAKKGEHWGKTGLASLRRRLFSTSL